MKVLEAQCESGLTPSERLSDEDEEDEEDDEEDEDSEPPHAVGTLFEAEISEPIGQRAL